MWNQKEHKESSKKKSEPNIQSAHKDEGIGKGNSKRKKGAWRCSNEARKKGLRLEEMMEHILAARIRKKKRIKMVLIFFLVFH